MHSEQQSNFKTRMSELSTGSTYFNSSQKQPVQFQKNEEERLYKTSNVAIEIRMMALDQIEQGVRRQNQNHSANCCLQHAEQPTNNFVDQTDFFGLDQAQIQQQELSEIVQQPSWINELENDNLPYQMMEDEEDEGDEEVEYVEDPNEDMQNQMQDTNKLNLNQRQSKTQSPTHHFRKSIATFFKKILEVKIKAANDPKLLDIFELFSQCKRKRDFSLLLKDHSQLQTYLHPFFKSKADQPEDFRKIIIKFVRIFSEISYEQVSNQVQKKQNNHQKKYNNHQKKYSNHKRKQFRNTYFREFLQDIKKGYLKVGKHQVVRILGP